MPSTTSYQPGDLILVDFPFTSGRQSKTRPALVVLDAGDADLLLARVTSQPPSAPYDVSISGWQQAGLLAPSTIRLHKLATLMKARVQRQLGSLAAIDRQQVGAALRQLAATW